VGAWVDSIKLVLLVALSMDAPSTEVPSFVDSGTAGAALFSSPDVGAPKVAVDTPSDEDVAMASKREGTYPPLSSSLNRGRAIRLITCVKSVMLVFQRLGGPTGLKPPEALLKLPGPLDPGGALARNGGGLRVRAQVSLQRSPRGDSRDTV
jgi:hypothetical protein